MDTESKGSNGRCRHRDTPVGIIHSLGKQQTDWAPAVCPASRILPGVRQLQWFPFCLYPKPPPKSLSLFASLSLLKELLKYLLPVKYLLALFGEGRCFSRL